MKHLSSRWHVGLAAVGTLLLALVVSPAAGSSAAFAGQAAATGSPPSPASTNAQVVGVVGGIELTWQDNSLNETGWTVTDGVTNLLELVEPGGWR